jgi:hypothetical protein
MIAKTAAYSKRPAAPLQWPGRSPRASGGPKIADYDLRPSCASVFGSGSVTVSTSPLIPFNLDHYFGG